MKFRRSSWAAVAAACLTLTALATQPALASAGTSAGCGIAGDLPILPVTGGVGADPASGSGPFSHSAARVLCASMGQSCQHPDSAPLGTRIYAPRKAPDVTSAPFR